MTRPKIGVPRDRRYSPGDIATRYAERVAENGYVRVSGSSLTPALDEAAIEKFRSSWDDLPLDAELVDGGRYRRRRYGRLLARFDHAERPTLTALPHGVFRQRAEHIPIYNGRARVFEPIAEDILTGDILRYLVTFDLSIARRLSDNADWEVGLHQIRIVAHPNLVGLPTPEGRHRDGHLYVGMHMLRRDGCQGGVSIIQHGSEPEQKFTLMSVLDSVLIDDRSVTHEVTPIRATQDNPAVRDMLLVDLNPYQERQSDSIHA